MASQLFNPKEENKRLDIDILLDMIRYCLNSLFENEIHYKNENQDHDDQCQYCPVFISHTFICRLVLLPIEK